MSAVILAVGDELVTGRIADTNSSWLSARLLDLGITTRYTQILPDDRAFLTESLLAAARQARWILVTGGLGPTLDDLTRESLADAMRVPLEIDVAAETALQRFFQSRGWPMSASNRRQAMKPAGTRLLTNGAGTAPGLEARLADATVFAMPGVPFEMKAMFEEHLVPRLGVHAGCAIADCCLNTLGMGESAVGEVLSDLMERGRNPLVGTTASAGCVSVRIRASAASAGEVQTVLRAAAAEVRARLGEAVFSEGEVSLAAVVGRLLRDRQATVATAESCTGGLLAAMLTEVPGASSWYAGGWVVYANELKTAALGVPAGLIESRGAVSEAVACQMARLALERANTNYALALTGVAGPDGGTPEKPVGTVWIALAQRLPAGPSVAAEHYFWPGPRQLVRERAARTALNLLRLTLLHAG